MQDGCDNVFLDKNHYFLHNGSNTSFMPLLCLEEREPVRPYCVGGD